MTTKTDFHTEHINTNTWVHSPVSVRASSHCTLHRLAQSPELCPSFHSHPHALMMCAVLLRQWSLLYLHPLLLAPPCRTSSTSLEVRSEPVHSSLKGYGLNLTRSYLFTGYEPNELRPHGDLCRVLHRVPDPPHSSPSNGSSRMWITMTPRSRRCFITHTEYTSITPSEKACLLVSRRGPCPNDRERPFVGENRGDLLWQEQTNQWADQAERDKNKLVWRIGIEG